MEKTKGNIIGIGIIAIVFLIILANACSNIDDNTPSYENSTNKEKQDFEKWRAKKAQKEWDNTVTR